MKGRRFLAVLVLAMVTVAAYTAEQYIDDVLHDRVVVGKLTTLAVRRHVKDLERAQTDPEFPYHFDEHQARRAIDFVQNLKHTKGEWARPGSHDPHLRLGSWQQFIHWVVFGWRRDDETRRFTRVYIEVARKNGKTTYAAGTANYCFMADRPREEGAEVYAVATKRDQAKISWDEAVRQLERQPVLRRATKRYRQSVMIPGTAARFMPLGKDSKTEDGLNAHFVLVDEYHAHPTDEMVQVVVDSMMARSQPLTWIITTAGFNQDGPCYRERDRIVRILERAVNPSADDPIDETTFGVIYTLDDNDDWTDEAVWPKANPNIGISVKWDRLREQVQRALASPHLQNDIKTKHFNVWTQAETRWILDEKWMACNFPVREDDLETRVCYGGLDLSASIDISAYVLCFPPTKDLENYAILPRFFIPEANIIDRERRDKVAYTYWIEQGLITPTPGDVIDYDFIEQRFLEDAERFEIMEIAYDPWKAQEIVNHLTEGGFTMVPTYQRYSGMAAPTEQFEKMVLGKRISHGGNPILRWMMACTEVKSDRQGNIMPMKPQRDRNGKRIDGIVAAIMAAYRAVIHSEDSSDPFEQLRGVNGAT